MLLRQATLAGIKAGTITHAFRRWTRPTVRSGGSLLTAAGQLTIVSVAPVTLTAITVDDSRLAGFSSRAELLAELSARDTGQLFRIVFGGLTVDPRTALRARAVTEADVVDLTARLERMDRRADGGPWTLQTLHIIADHPGVRAQDLCVPLGQAKAPFKMNVRKLKALGLTESLEVGYRLSPRGVEALQRLLNLRPAPELSRRRR